MNNQPQEARAAAGLDPERRRVRSFVRRAGRMTDGQKRALDRLWPRYGMDDGAGELDFVRLFGNDRPVVLEIGFGNGDATWRAAQSMPDYNFVGVEVHRPGIGRLLLALEREGLENVKVACADAVEWLRKKIAPGSLSGVRIFFPDPWPKKRHHKRRMIQPDFVQLLASRMRPGAVLHLATDWEPYAEYMLHVVLGSRRFERLEPKSDESTPLSLRPHTKYERRGERLGHPVTDLVFRLDPPA